MVTYSRGRCRGRTTELGQSREIAAREGTLKRFRRVDVVRLEAKEALTDSAARRKVVRREDLALDGREVDLDLIEPAGVNRDVDEHVRRPPRLQPGGRPAP